MADRQAAPPCRMPGRGAPTMSPIPSALEITRDIVRMDTRNPPGREVECAHYLGDLLGAAGLDVSYHEFAAERTSLVAVLRGRGDRLRRLLPSGQGRRARRGRRHRHRRAHGELSDPRPQGRALAQGGDRGCHRSRLDAGARRQRALQSGALGDQARRLRLQRHAPRAARKVDPQCRHHAGRAQSELRAGPRRVHHRHQDATRAGPWANSHGPGGISRR